MAAEEDFEYPIETDPEVLINDWLADMRVYFPNFDPSPNSLSYRAVAGLANMLAVGMDVAAVIPPAIFRTVGSSLHSIDPNEALPSLSETTWTAVDNAGYETIPAGTLLSIDEVLFETTQDVPFPSGTTVVTPIGISALEAGASGNDLGAAGYPVGLEEGYPFVDSITLVRPTSAGQDGETTEDFTTRLRRTLRVMYPHAVRGTDLEIIARNIPSVYRALSLDNYDLPTATANVEGVATVLLQGFDGQDVPSPIKDLYKSIILPDDRRLVNLNLYVGNLVLTPVNVNFAHTTHTGYEPSTVTEEGEAAVADMFDPTKWGLPGSGEEPLWTNKTIVSVYDVAGALDRVPGLDRVTLIEIGLNANAPTAGDKNLTGIGPLTTPGTITGTAV